MFFSYERKLEGDRFYPMFIRIEGYHPNTTPAQEIAIPMNDFFQTSWSLNNPRGYIN